MQVKFYASLRQVAGTKLMDVEFHPGISLRDVLVEVTQRVPGLVKFVWKEQGELSEFVHVFVNGVNFHQLSGLDTPLNAEDHVDIFPPLVGGAMMLSMM